MLLEYLTFLPLSINLRLGCYRAQLKLIVNTWWIPCCYLCVTEKCKVWLSSDNQLHPLANTITRNYICSRNNNNNKKKSGVNDKFFKRNKGSASLGHD